MNCNTGKRQWFLPVRSIMALLSEERRVFSCLILFREAMREVLKIRDQLLVYCSTISSLF